jgi:rubrerythrin
MGKFLLRRTECGAREVEMEGIKGMIAEGSDRTVEPLEVAGYAALHATGDAAAGEFHCRECGYGVIVQRLLPRCPMCSGTEWEPAGMRALRRRAAALLR